MKGKPTPKRERLPEGEGVRAQDKQPPYLSYIYFINSSYSFIIIAKFEYSDTTKELDIEPEGLVLVEELNSLFGIKVAALME